MASAGKYLLPSTISMSSLSARTTPSQIAFAILYLIRLGPLRLHAPIHGIPLVQNLVERQQANVPALSLGAESERPVGRLNPRLRTARLGHELRHIHHRGKFRWIVAAAAHLVGQAL